MRRRLATIVAISCLGLGLVSCGSDDGPGKDEALVRVSGAATVTDAAGLVESVAGTTTVAFGDTIVVDDGTAVVELAGGQVYELRSGAVPSEMEVGAPPTLLRGDALVSGGFPAQLRYESTTVSAQGAMKMVSSVPSVVSYAGRARIDGAGELDEVLGLRQVVLTASAQPEPLVYDGADDWDRRYLGDAVAFGERLEALARGYTADLGTGGGRSVGFFEAVVPALAEEREFGSDLLTDRPVGETLVGASIVVQGQTGTFRERWEGVFSFRDEGAAWGLVALDQGVSSAPLLETVELAVGTTAPAEMPTPTDEPSDTVAPPSPSTSSDPPPATTGATTTTTAPPTSPPPTGLLTPVLDPVNGILEDLLDVLGL